MASLASGYSTGVARGATLHSVKVGNTPTGIDEGDVVDGLSWVRSNAPAAAVVNVSLTPEDGTLSNAFRNAINSLASNNISVVLGAGNGGPDLVGDDTAGLGFCSLHSGVLVVSAIDASGNRPGYANFGSCGDLFSPGFGLRAALAGTAWGYSDVSGGTSSATALVTGIVSTILQQRPNAGVGEVVNQVVGSATSGILQPSIGNGSPNRLANSLHLFYPAIVGPTQIVVTVAPVTATWSVAPTGGDGTYAYEWRASTNGGPWVVVGNGQSYTRTIPRFSHYEFVLKVKVTSGGEAFDSPFGLGVVVSCGGC